jgi:hypothetical protein
MKTKIFLLIIISFTCLISKAQHYDSNVYDANGQYLKETKPPKYQTNVFDIGMYCLGDEIHPRATIEGYSVFDSGIGLWSFNRFNKPVVKPEWKEAGYVIPDDYNLGISLALSYDFVTNNLTWYKTFLGLAYQSGQMYFGPMAGIYVSHGEWELKAFGVYAIKSAYKDHYEDESMNKYSPIYGEPVYIKGFDPNSWYKVSINYQMTKRFNLGIQSERFYGTNFVGLYDLQTSWRDMDELYVKAMSGFDFEFKHNTFFMGLVLVL